MAKFTLSFVDEYPFSLLGINASIRGYRLAWNLNKILNINLSREQALITPNAIGEESLFNYYLYTHEEQAMRYRLIENRSGNSLFLPEQPRADYLLCMDDNPLTDVVPIIRSIRSIQGVVAVFAIDIPSLKSKQNLLLTS